MAETTGGVTLQVIADLEKAGSTKFSKIESFMSNESLDKLCIKVLRNSL